MIKRILSLLLLLGLLSESSHACGNSPTRTVIVQASTASSTTKVTLRCRRVIVSKHCNLVDLRTKKLVKQVCQDQCLLQCQPKPIPPSAPTPAPKPLQAIPPGPYITSTTNSKVITLPNPTPPTNILTGASRVNCPHLLNTPSVLKLWHDPATWGGVAIPAAGSNVTLPANTRVLLAQSIVEQLGIITIPVSSELVLGEAAAGITLRAQGFSVQGKLTAGSETCRIETPIGITLWGARPVDAVIHPPSPTYKGIYVTGRLSLHGKRYFSTWSRLAKTVQPNDTILLLQQAVNWQAGQRVVLTPSIMYDSRAYHQNEVVTVRLVDTTSSSVPAGVGAVVHLNEPVQYQHTANEYYQVEAGLLTRAILIQGSPEDSEPTDLDPLTCRTSLADYGDWSFYYNLPMPCTNLGKTGYGGHVMIADTGQAQVEGVELYRMGQTNVLGRYPFHFHMLKSCPTCYFKDSSVHRSFYRCISIHGTHNSTVTENVAYDVTGYCYYLEDGVEQDNTLSFNLAAHIHTIGPSLPGGYDQGLDDYDQSSVAGSELTLPADVTASGFYITNVHNNIIGNAASGVSKRLY
jgi:hypothetical protein